MTNEQIALDHERMLFDLLAVIHRDGGHRRSEVGTEQAWMEAMMLVPTHFTALEALPVMREALGSIEEYWNRDRNDAAMYDACWHNIEVAHAALASLPKEVG